MNQPQMVSIKNSIATKLLKVVFSVYLIIAITVTLTHMIAEFYNTKNAIKNELESINITFKPTLVNAVWGFDLAQIKATLNGMVNIPTLKGVKLEIINGAENGKTEKIGVGHYVDEQGKQIFREKLSLTDEEINIYTNKKSEDLFSLTFPLINSDNPENPSKIGDMTLYSSTSVVLKKVQYGFLFIIVNSLIKTGALWIIFLWFSRKLLTMPLSALTNATSLLNMDNLSSFKIDIKTTGNNELKVLENTFNSMVKKLYQAKERMTSLQVFFNTTITMTDNSNAMSSIFTEILKYLQVDHAALFHKKNGDQWELIQHYTLLNNPFPFEFSDDKYEKIFKEKVKNLVVINNEECELYRDVNDQPFFKDANFTFMKWDSPETFVMCFLRSDQPIFDSIELEYLESVNNEVQKAKYSTKMIEKNTQMQDELQTAELTQNALFPPNHVDHKYFQLSAYYARATMCGGDWWNYIIDEKHNRVIYLIADVTGHGVGAAIITAILKGCCDIIESLINNQTMDINTNDILAFFNQSIYNASKGEFYTSVAILSVDLETGDFSFSNGGHLSPIIHHEHPNSALKKNQHVEYLNLIPADYLVGFKPDTKFRVLNGKLQKNDLVFLYTDGLTEGYNSAFKEFGKVRLFNLLEMVGSKSTKEVVSEVKRVAYEYYGEVEITDDLTYLVFRYI